MSRLVGRWLALIGLFVSLSACSAEEEESEAEELWLAGCEGSVRARDVPDQSSGGSGITGPISITNERSLFDARIGARLSLCRKCHVAGGVADSPDGRRFLLSSDRTRDYDNLHAAWMELGAGVDDNLLLHKPSGRAPDGHSGGSPWPKGSDAYQDLRALLSCWAEPSSCADALSSRGLSPTLPEELPLIGDLAANGGRNYAAVYCESKPDCATLPPDPRELVAGANIENPSYREPSLPRRRAGGRSLGSRGRALPGGWRHRKPRRGCAARGLGARERIHLGHA